MVDTGTIQKATTTMSSRHREKRLTKAVVTVTGDSIAQPAPMLNVNPPNPTPIESTPGPWQNSTAKKLLHDDILAGRTKNKSSTEVYYSRPEFQCYKRQRFTTNFRNLDKTIQARMKCADNTKAAYDHDLPILQAQRAQGFHYDGSDLQKQLRRDVQEGLTDGLKPQMVRISRQIYKECGLSVQSFAGFLWTERIRHERNLQSEEYRERMKFINARVDA